MVFVSWDPLAPPCLPTVQSILKMAQSVSRVSLCNERDEESAYNHHESISLRLSRLERSESKGKG